MNLIDPGDDSSKVMEDSQKFKTMLSMMQEKHKPSRRNKKNKRNLSFMEQVFEKHNSKITRQKKLRTKSLIKTVNGFNFSKKESPPRIFMKNKDFTNDINKTMVWKNR